MAKKKPKKQNKGGRPSKLTPDTVTKICNAIRAGNYFSTACEYAGIHEATGHAWLAIARGDNPDVAPTKKFIEFYESVKKAQADAEVAAIARIQKAARGGEVISRKTTTRVIKRKNGDVEEVSVIDESLLPPQWQADAWAQERMHPEKWGRRVRTELTGKDGGPVQTEGTGNGQVIVLLPDNGRGDGVGIPADELPVIVPEDPDAPVVELPPNGRDVAG